MLNHCICLHLERAEHREYVILLEQVLTGQLELDTDMPTDDFVSMAAQQLGATPVVTCYYRNGKAYLSSVRLTSSGYSVVEFSPTCSPACWPVLHQHLAIVLL